MNIKKLIAVFTTACFVITSFAGQAAFSAFEMHKNATQFSEVLDQFVIPTSVGRITKGRYFGSDKVVVNIQDLHCHPEVQRNISKMLGILSDRYKISNVYVEGAAGDVSTAWINDIKDKDLRKEIVESLIDQGKLSGTEYYSITQGKFDLLKGVEDEKPFKDNIVRLGKIIEKQDVYAKELSAMRKDLALLQERHFNSKNQRFNRILQDYKDKKITTDKFYALLAKYVEKINSDPENYNNLFTLRKEDYGNMWGYLGMVEKGKVINYRRLTRELQEFVNVLKAKLPYQAYNFLLKKTDNFSKLDELYIYLSKFVKEYNLKLEGNYPNLNEFFAYIDQSQAVNPILLLKEERRLVEDIRIGLSQDVTEVEISFLVDFFNYFEDYMTNHLTAEDYAYFVQRVPQFKSIWARYAFSNRMQNFASDFPMLDEFYKVNDQRNRYFLKNMLGDYRNSLPVTEQSKDNNANIKKTVSNLAEVKEVMVVVTGGFHTEGLEKLLNDRGISYLEVTPNVTQDTRRSSEVYMEIARKQAKILSNALATALSSFVYGSISSYKIMPDNDGFELVFDRADGKGSETVKIPKRSTSDAKNINHGVIFTKSDILLSVYKEFKSKMINTGELLKTLKKATLGPANPSEWNDIFYEFITSDLFMSLFTGEGLIYALYEYAQQNGLTEIGGIPLTELEGTHAYFQQIAFNHELMQDKKKSAAFPVIAAALGGLYAAQLRPAQKAQVSAGTTEKKIKKGNSNPVMGILGPLVILPLIAIIAVNLFKGFFDKLSGRYNKPVPSGKESVDIRETAEPQEETKQGLEPHMQIAPEANDSPMIVRIKGLLNELQDAETFDNRTNQRAIDVARIIESNGQGINTEAIDVLLVTVSARDNTIKPLYFDPARKIRIYDVDKIKESLQRRNLSIEHINIIMGMLNYQNGQQMNGEETSLLYTALIYLQLATEFDSKPRTPKAAVENRNYEKNGIKISIYGVDANKELTDEKSKIVATRISVEDIENGQSNVFEFAEGIEIRTRDGKIMTMYDQAQALYSSLFSALNKTNYAASYANSETTYDNIGRNEAKERVEKVIKANQNNLLPQSGKSQFNGKPALTRQSTIDSYLEKRPALRRIYNTNSWGIGKAFVQAWISVTFSPVFELADVSAALIDDKARSCFIEEHIPAHMTVDQKDALRNKLIKGLNFIGKAVEISTKVFPFSPNIAAKSANIISHALWNITHQRAALTNRASQPGRVIAHGDIHGELNGFKENLQAAGLIDGTGNWIGREAVLVQMGDVIDRGPHSLEAYDYLEKLQDQARQAGGDVIRLLGNHELMLLEGNPVHLLRSLPGGICDKNFKIAEQFTKRIIDDVKKGRVVAAYSMGGRLYVHGGLRSAIRELLKKEIAHNKDIISENVTLNLIVGNINELMLAAIEKSDYSHPLFQADIQRGGKAEIAGIFWNDFENLLNSTGAGAVRQVVGHTPQLESPDDIIYSPNLDRIDVDAGLFKKYGGKQAFLVFEDGAIKVVRRDNEGKYKEYIIGYETNENDENTISLEKELSELRSQVKVCNDEIDKLMKELEDLDPGFILRETLPENELPEQIQRVQENILGLSSQRGELNTRIFRLEKKIYDESPQSQKDEALQDAIIRMRISLIRSGKPVPKELKELYFEMENKIRSFEFFSEDLISRANAVLQMMQGEMDDSAQQIKFDELVDSFDKFNKDFLSAWRSKDLQKAREAFKKMGQMPLDKLTPYQRANYQNVESLLRSLEQEKDLLNEKASKTSGQETMVYSEEQINRAIQRVETMYGYEAGFIRKYVHDLSYAVLLANTKSKEELESMIKEENDAFQKLYTRSDLFLVFKLQLALGLQEIQNDRNGQDRHDSGHSSLITESMKSLIARLGWDIRSAKAQGLIASVETIFHYFIPGHFLFRMHDFEKVSSRDANLRNAAGISIYAVGMTSLFFSPVILNLPLILLFATMAAAAFTTGHLLHRALLIREGHQEDRWDGIIGNAGNALFVIVLAIDAFTLGAGIVLPFVFSFITMAALHWIWNIMAYEYKRPGAVLTTSSPGSQPHSVSPEKSENMAENKDKGTDPNSKLSGQEIEKNMDMLFKRYAPKDKSILNEWCGLLIDVIEKQGVDLDTLISNNWYRMRTAFHAAYILRAEIGENPDNKEMIISYIRSKKTISDSGRDDFLNEDLGKSKKWTPMNIILAVGAATLIIPFMLNANPAMALTIFLLGYTSLHVMNPVTEWRSEIEPDYERRRHYIVTSNGQVRCATRYITLTARVKWHIDDLKEINKLFPQGLRSIEVYEMENSSSVSSRYYMIIDSKGKAHVLSESWRLNETTEIFKLREISSKLNEAHPAGLISVQFMRSANYDSYYGIGADGTISEVYHSRWPAPDRNILRGGKKGELSKLIHKAHPYGILTAYKTGNVYCTVGKDGSYAEHWFGQKSEEWRGGSSADAKRILKKAHPQGLVSAQVVYRNGYTTIYGVSKDGTVSEVVYGSFIDESDRYRRSTDEWRGGVDRKLTKWMRKNHPNGSVAMQRLDAGDNEHYFGIGTDNTVSHLFSGRNELMHWVTWEDTLPEIAPAIMRDNERTVAGMINEEEKLSYWRIALSVALMEYDMSMKHPEEFQAQHDQKSGAEVLVKATKVSGFAGIFLGLLPALYVSQIFMAWPVVIAIAVVGVAAGYYGARSTGNLVTHAVIIYHFLNANDVKAMRQLGAIKIENGNIFPEMIVPTDVRDIEDLVDVNTLKNTGLKVMIDGKAKIVWISAQMGEERPLLYIEGITENDKEQAAGQLNRLFSSIGKSGAKGQQQIKLENLLNRIPGVTLGRNARISGVAVDYDPSAKVRYTDDGTPVVPARLFNAADETRTRFAAIEKAGEAMQMRQGDSYALGQTNFLKMDNVDTLEQLKEKLSFANALNNGQRIVNKGCIDGLTEDELTQIVSLAKKSGIQLYAALNEGDDPLVYRNAGFAGYSVDNIVHNFILGSKQECQEIKGYNGDFDALDRMIRQAGAKPKIHLASELEKIKGVDRVLWVNKIQELFGANILSLFTPEAIDEDYVINAAWGIDILPSVDQLSALEKAADADDPQYREGVAGMFLERLEGEITDKAKLSVLKKAYLKAVIKHVMARAAIEEAGYAHGLADRNFERLLGDLLMEKKVKGQDWRIINPGAEVTREIDELEERANKMKMNTIEFNAELNNKILEAKENAVAVDDIIFMILKTDKKAMFESERLQQRLFNKQAIDKVLAAA